MENNLDFSQSLFKVPFANGGKICAQPYKEFAKGFCIGISDENATVVLRQNSRESVFVSPPDHSFSLGIEIEDIAQAKWVSLEGNLDATQFSSNTRLTALVALTASTHSELNLDLRLIRKSGGFKDLRLGTISPKKNGEYTSVTISTPLSSLSDIIHNDTESALLILFLPVKSPQSVYLHIFNVFLSDSGYE